MGLGGVPAPAGWCPHMLGQDWGDICFLVIQNCPLRAPSPLLSVSVLIGLKMLRTEPCLGRCGVCQAGSGENGRGIPTTGCSLQAEHRLPPYAERPPKCPGPEMEMTGDSPLASGAGEGDHQEPSAVPPPLPALRLCVHSSPEGPPCSVPGGGGMQPRGRLRGEGLPYTRPHGDGEESPCAPAPSSIPGCGYRHGGSPLTPGCRCLASPLLPARRCSGCPLTPGC